MAHSLNDIVAGIDLASYSSSSGYLGFIENPKMRSDDFVNSIIGGLLDNIPTDSLSLVTSLCVIPSILEVSRLYELPKGYVSDYLVPLKESAILTELEDIELQKLEIFNQPHRSVLEKALYTVMKIDGVEGHLFLRVPQMNLFIYPHEDIGFGFIESGYNREIRSTVGKLVDSIVDANNFEVNVNL